MNLKQPHKSESNTRKLLLYHLRKHIRVMNKIKRVRWSYVYCTCTLDIEAPWFWNTDIKVLFLCERRICRIGNVNFFIFGNCGFGIWVNCDAALRYSRATMCGIAVFVPPLHPPHLLIFITLRGKGLHSTWSLSNKCPVPSGSLFYIVGIQGDCEDLHIIDKDDLEEWWDNRYFINIHTNTSMLSV